MAIKVYPNQERLRLLYDYKDGLLINKVDRNNQAKKGSVVGYVTKSKRGYPRRVTHIKSIFYFHSRLVWIWHYGEILLNMQIDHKDRDTLNDRIENLRSVTHSGNMQNQIRKGYSWETNKNRWRSRITINNKTIHLGYFETEKEAAAAYQNGKGKYHKIGEV